MASEADEASEKLQQLLDEVRDEPTFLRFIKALSDDWFEDRTKEERNPSSPYVPTINGWENGTIGDYLESAHAWGKTWLDRPEENERGESPWRRAAAILYAGKYYE